ncbi:DNA helicase RecD, partial [Streptomyces sp. SID7909]|nr:DNA helicase RecD [Streptomyces sp. SID7909]
MTALPRGESPGSPATEDDTVAVPDDPGPAGAADAASEAEPGPATDSVADEGTAAGEAPDGGPGPEAGAEGAPALSEAEAEIAAQRELRERIEKRKAEKDGPIEAGGKLSGTAADLLAAVRAVEGGQKPATAFYDSPAPTPARRTTAPAPAPVREQAPAPRAASPESV